MYKATKIKRIYLFNILTFIIFISNGQAQEVGSFLTCEDSIYKVEYTFTTRCKKNMLLEICFEFSHLIEFAKQKNTTIKLLESGENWYTVEYDYRYFIYTNNSIYKKTIIPQENLVKFEMINYSQNIGILPKVLAASGYYKVIANEKENEVTYYQKTILDRQMDRFYLKSVKRKTEEFFLNLKEYIEKFEDKND